MPLEAFIDETMRNYDREPTAAENRVEMAISYDMRNGMGASTRRSRPSIRYK